MPLRARNDALPLNAIEGSLDSYDEMLQEAAGSPWFSTEAPTLLPEVSRELESEHPGGPGHLCTMEEVAERERIRRELVTRARELEEKNRELEEKNQELEERNRELRLTREEADEAKRLISLFSSSVPLGFAYLDRNLRYQKANKFLAETHGLDPKEIVGKHLSEVLMPGVAHALSNYEEVLRTGRTVTASFVAPVPHRDNEEHSWECLYFPVHNAIEEIVGVGVVVKDVTERVRYEHRLREQAVELEIQMLHGRGLNTELRRQLAEIQRLNDELEDSNRELVRMTAATEIARREAEEANRSKADFLAAMSHDLRTPLNAIGGYIEILEMELQGPITPEQARSLDRIKHNQRHLTTLIRDILHFAKLEVGHLEVQMADVRVADVIGALEPLIEPQMRARGLDYSCSMVDAEARLQADADKIQQVLLNLLTNAIKFTDPGGRISVEAEAKSDWVHIRVRDTGCGIPAERIESIFSPFVQAHTDTRPESTQLGVGLGLSISRELTRLMGGELGVESSPEGSVFTLSLRRGRREVDRLIVSDEIEEESL